MYFAVEKKKKKKKKMATKLKIEKTGDEILIVHCYFSVSQNELKF